MTTAQQDTTRPPDGDAGPDTAGSPQLRRELQDLGLTPYEARLVLAMLQLAPTTAFELAHASGVPRISTYPVLRGLIDKQLADRLPGDGPAVYGGVDRDTLLSRLDALKHERLRGHCQHSQHLRRRLDQAIPHQSSAAGPPLRLLATAAQQHDTFQRLAQQAHSEALIAAVPEEDGDALEPGLGELANPAETRVLYQAGQGGGASPAIAATHACHDAGAHARTVERLSVEVAIFDRTTALVTLERPVDGQPATLVWLDHPGVAAALADAFTDRWAGGAPCRCHAP